MSFLDYANKVNDLFNPLMIKRNKLLQALKENTKELFLQRTTLGDMYPSARHHRKYLWKRWQYRKLFNN